MTSKEIGSDIGKPPHFDGTNYPYWHIRMSCFLEAKGLGVWRVTEKGMKPLSRPDNPTKADENELHLNAIARNSILESLSMDVFNRVYGLKSAHEIWNTIKELHDGSSDIRDQKYSLLKKEFDDFKMFPHELANDMYSRLNVIVNELNSLGLNKLSDGDVTRKIVSILPKEKYAQLVTCLHFKNLNEMKTTKVLNRIIAYEMTMKITKDPSPSPSSQEIVLTSKQDMKDEKQEEKEKIEKKKSSSKSRKKSHKQASSSSSSEASSSSDEESDDEKEENDDDDEASSSASSDDEEVQELIKGVSKLLKKLERYGVSMEKVSRYSNYKLAKKHKCLGCGEKGHYIEYCPLMEERRKQQKKERKKKKKSKKALTSIARTGWDVSSSSEEDNRCKSHSFLPSSSSSHICLMAKGMSDSDVSDDDSSPSFDELADLVRNQEVAIKQLLSTNEDLKEKLASSSSNYKELAEKFDLILSENDELTTRIEKLEKAKTTSHIASTPIFDKKSKMDASTSCYDLIDESCSPYCNENVVIENYDDLIAQENDELKKEVESLMMSLAKLKGKEKASSSKKQPSQDNRPKMVKKLENGETVTCYSCHQEGHKSYECKNKKKGEKKKVISNTNKKPYLKVDKMSSTPYLLKKKDNKVVAHMINKQGKGWNQPIWVPKDIISTMKGSKKVWVPKAT
ncbi:unnamed protein product [Urochloa humidicola]